jgi:hypothetical protein
MANNNINSNMKHRTLVASIRQSQEQAIRKSKASSGQGGCTHRCSSVVKFGIDDDDDEKEKKSDATSNNTSESSGSGNAGSVASSMSQEQAMIKIKASSGQTRSMSQEPAIHKSKASSGPTGSMSQEQAMINIKASSGLTGGHKANSVIKVGSDVVEKKKKSDATSKNNSGSGNVGSVGSVGSVASSMSKEQAMINIKASSGLTGGHNDSSVIKFGSDGDEKKGKVGCYY